MRVEQADVIHGATLRRIINMIDMRREKGGNSELLNDLRDAAQASIMRGKIATIPSWREPKKRVDGISLALIMIFCTPLGWIGMAILAWALRV